jgi:hypothetical protein
VSRRSAQLCCAGDRQPAVHVLLVGLERARRDADERADVRRRTSLPLGDRDPALLRGQPGVLERAHDPECPVHLERELDADVARAVVRVERVGTETEASPRDPERRRRDAPRPVPQRDVEAVMDPVPLEEVLIRRARDVLGRRIDPCPDRAPVAEEVPERGGIARPGGEVRPWPRP